MFYTYDQNNSGGYFIQNEDVTQYVIIEAECEDEAVRMLHEIVEDYSDYCPCCGERWSDWCCNETIEPCIYDEPLNQVKKSAYKDEAIIYYLDGSKKIYKFK